MVSTKTRIAGVEFKTYVCNASGPLDSTLEELESIANSQSSAITMKSCTLEPREGNPKPRYARLEFGSLQSMGLPNLGYKKYIEFASQLKKHNKPVIASIAGLSVGDYRKMMATFQNSDADLIEVNLSCPNLEGKFPIAYNLKQTEMVLRGISNLGEKPVGLKLPPYYGLDYYEKIAEMIERYNIQFITCINSVGSALVIDAKTETPVIRPKKGFGGLGGECIKPIALADVRTFYELLNKRISIFGVGGIKNGTDAFEFLLAGADAVQVATTFEKEGTRCFERINSELEEILFGKGYASINDAKGKLKYL